MNARQLLELMLKVAEADVTTHREALAHAEQHATATRAALIELDVLEAYAEEGRAAEDNAATAARGPRG